jgi:hypothetical protein
MVIKGHAKELCFPCNVAAPPFESPLLNQRLKPPWLITTAILVMLNIFARLRCRYDDSPLAIWKTATTKQGNVQFRELHGSDDYCLTYFDKDVYVDGDVLVASAGVQVSQKPCFIYARLSPVLIQMFGFVRG